MKVFKTPARKRKGAALVEYALLVAGVALVSAAAISLFGHKTSDMVASVAAVLPGAHDDDNGPIISGKLIETSAATANGISLDAVGIAGKVGVGRLGDNLLGAANGGNAAIQALVLEANP